FAQRIITQGADALLHSHIQLAVRFDANAKRVLSILRLLGWQRTDRDRFRLVQDFIRNRVGTLPELGFFELRANFLVVRFAITTPRRRRRRGLVGFVRAIHLGLFFFLRGFALRQ